MPNPIKLKLPHMRAFDRAVHETKVLSQVERAANYAGAYMYMHSDAAGDHFKNIDTRRYVLSPAALDPC